MLNKKFIIFFISIIISYSINSFAQDEASNQKEMKFNLSYEDEWIIKCSDIDKKYYKRDASGGRSPYSFKAINDTIKSKYQDEYKFLKNKNIIKNAQLDNLNDAVISILRIDNENKEIDITENVKTGDNLFCSEKVSRDTLVYKTKPIFFFKGNETCKSKFGFDNEHIAEQIENNTINFFENYLSIGLDDAKNKERIQEEVNKYSEQHTGIRCSKNNIPTFTIKNINEYLETNKDLKKENLAIQSNENENENLEKTCRQLQEEGILNGLIENGIREDCQEYLDNINEINTEFNSIQDNLKELKNLIETEEVREVINSRVNEDIERNISSFDNEISNFNNIEKLNEEFSKLKDKILKIRNIVLLFDTYAEICINRGLITNIFNYTSYEYYEDMCINITQYENELNGPFSNLNNYIADRKNKIKEFWNTVKNLNIKVSNQVKEINKALKDEESLENQRQKTTKKINEIQNDLKDLKDKIESKTNSLKKQNQDFKKEVVFPDQLSELNNFDAQKETLSKKIKQLEKNIENFSDNDEIYNIFIEELEYIKINLNDLESNLKDYELEYETYEINQKEREEYKSELKKKEEKEELEKKKQQEKAKQKQEKLEKQKKIEEEKQKLNNLIDKIKKQDVDISNQLLEIKSQIKSLENNVTNFISNFDEKQLYEVNYSEDLKNLSIFLQSIDDLIQELDNTIDDLPNDFDRQMYNIKSKEELKESIPVLKYEIKVIKSELIPNLSSNIDEANKLLGNQLEKLAQIAQENEEEFGTLSDTVTKKDNEIANLKDSHKKEITKLNNQNKKLDSSIINLENNISTKNMYIYILIGLLILLSGLLFFFISRRKSSDSNDNNVQSYLSRIDELEQQLRRQSANQTAPVFAPDPTINPNTPAQEPKKEPSPQEIKNERLRKLYEDYEAAMKNPNLIEAFRMNYNAIGLERESKVVTGRRVTLRKVNTSFDRAIYWVVEHDKKLLVFGGRMLKVQAPSLLADDGTMARDLLQGIFELQTGPDLKTHKCAVVNRNNLIYEVMVEGVLQLPKVD